MDKIIEIRRSLLDNCTIGEWFHEGSQICYSLELPWLSNIPFKSCIPPGDYSIKPISTEKHPDSFFLENKDLGVSWQGDTIRTLIEVHIANYIRQIVGCLAPGMDLHQSIGDVPWVGKSGDAMGMLNQLIDSEGWKIRIIQ
jgi:hypothetical protein